MIREIHTKSPTPANRETPMVSVIMSARAVDQDFFKRAVDSILNQTFGDFEFIIVDDGLSEQNRLYLKSLDDKRLVLLRNEINIGQSRSVNKALRMAKGKYIARMDADDVSLPTRLKTQVDFMESNQRVLACGSMARIIGTRRLIPEVFPDYESWQIGFLFANNMVHPTMFFRRKELSDLGIFYDEDQLYAQDYMFWADVSHHGEVTLIPEVLLEYRVHSGQITSTKAEQQLVCANKVRAREFARIGINLSEKDLSLLSDVTHRCLKESARDYDELITDLLSRGKSSLGCSFRTFKAELRFHMFKAGIRDLVRQRSAKCVLIASWWRAALNPLCWMRCLRKLSLYSRRKSQAKSSTF